MSLLCFINHIIIFSSLSFLLSSFLSQPFLWWLSLSIIKVISNYRHYHSTIIMVTISIIIIFIWSSLISLSLLSTSLIFLSYHNVYHIILSSCITMLLPLQAFYCPIPKNTTSFIIKTKNKNIIFFSPTTHTKFHKNLISPFQCKAEKKHWTEREINPNVCSFAQFSLLRSEHSSNTGTAWVIHFHKKG